MWVNKNLRAAQSGPPWGTNWVADSIKEEYAAQGWYEAEEVPEFEKTKAEKSAAVIAEYQAKIDKLLAAETILKSLDKDSTTIHEELKAAYDERNVKLIQISKE